MATPLMIAVLGLELSDVMFAVDSAPAALAATRDTFIVYTSNVSAVCGLRTLYIVLVQAIAQLRYLHYGLGAVLTFVAVKMAAHRWVTIEPLVAVCIILLSIGISVGLSLWQRRNKAQSRTTGGGCTRYSLVNIRLSVDQRCHVRQHERQRQSAA